jgi:hypothetical protein
MSVTHETAVSEEAVVRLLRATKANDAASGGPKRPRAQTDQCPPFARFAAVCRFGLAKWTVAEERHVLACTHCTRLRDLFVAETTETTLTNLSPAEETATGIVPPKLE